MVKIKDALIRMLGGYTQQDVLKKNKDLKEELMECKEQVEDYKRLASFETAQRESLNRLYVNTLRDKQQIEREKNYFETMAIAVKSDFINLKKWMMRGRQ